MEHIDAQLHAIAQLTFQQWFTGRAAYFRDHMPVAADLGEQAMRADYIADKAWWYLTYEPGTYPSFARAAQAATSELPTPVGQARSGRRGWLEEIDIAITAAAGQIPSRQWATTLIPSDILTQVRGGRGRT